MPFDVGRFESAQFQPRTKRVPVPGLADFFPDGEPPEWEVRGITCAELHRAIEAKGRQSQLQAIVDAIATAGEAAQTIRKALGLSGATPGEIVKRIEMLHIASVQPQIALEAAVKLAETFPIEFLTLTDTITELTGKGFDLVKPPAASHPIPPSTPA